MVSHSDSGGGADRAAHNILAAVRRAGVDARLWVQDKYTDDPAVSSFAEVGARRNPAQDHWSKRLDSDLLWLQKSSNSVHRSFNVIPSGLLGALASHPHNLTHLHWLGSETASIKEIGAIPGPVVWTLHDSWPFCGAEHHPEDASDKRFASRYSRASRRPGNSRVDLDAWTFRRKERHFNRPRWLVGPSRWMVEMAQQSSLAADWPTAVIPNPIDNEVFFPRERQAARATWGMQPDAHVVLFGAVGGANVAKKGWDLFRTAMERIATSQNGMRSEIWVFGDSAPDDSIAGLPIRSAGYITSQEELAALYSAADVHVVASRQESFSQTAAEAAACGTPVAAWALGGLLDVVDPGITGVLAQPFDTEDLAHAITRAAEMRDQVRVTGPQRAARLWAPSVVGERYADAYSQAIDLWASGVST